MTRTRLAAMGLSAAAAMFVIAGSPERAEARHRGRYYAVSYYQSYCPPVSYYYYPAPVVYYRPAPVYYTSYYSYPAYRVYPAYSYSRAYYYPRHGFDFSFSFSRSHRHHHH